MLAMYWIDFFRLLAWIDLSPKISAALVIQKNNGKISIYI